MAFLTFIKGGMAKDADIILYLLNVYISPGIPKRVGNVNAQPRLQHVYIPLLPVSMLGFIQAPMPYIVGVHRCVRMCMH